MYLLGSHRSCYKSFRDLPSGRFTSAEILLPPSITHSIPPPVLTQQMIHTLSHSAFILILVSAGFPTTLPRLFLPDHSSVPAWDPVLLAAAMRGYQNFHLVFLEHVHIAVHKSGPSNPAGDQCSLQVVGGQALLGH
jgi:hypothetical protein